MHIVRQNECFRRCTRANAQSSAVNVRGSRAVDVGPTLAGCSDPGSPRSRTLQRAKKHMPYAFCAWRRTNSRRVRCARERGNVNDLRAGRLLLQLVIFSSAVDRAHRRRSICQQDFMSNSWRKEQIARVHSKGLLPNYAARRQLRKFANFVTTVHRCSLPRLDGHNFAPMGCWNS
jgi:hypothetical protein